MLGDVAFNNLNRKYNEALKYYTAASEIKQYSVECMIKMGACYEKMREFDDAIRCYKKGHRRDKNCFEAIYRLGVVMIRNNQKSKGMDKL